MSLFNFIQKRGSKPIPPAPGSIRREIIQNPSARARASHSITPNSKSPSPSIQGRVRKVGKAQTNGVRKRKRPSQTRLISDSDGSNSDASSVLRVTRQRVDHEDKRPRSRNLRRQIDTLQDGNHSFPMVHAAHIASVDKRSRFELVEPIQSDDFKPLDDIIETLEVIVVHYMQGLDASNFTDDSHGLLRRLKRAREKKDGLLYTSIMREWNEGIAQMKEDGVFTEVLDKMNWLDLSLIERILTQTYVRTVSPRVSTLRQYENGTDNVYGELLPKFASEVFRVTGLRPDHVFVDLGSGVGNVVLQAALEAGCESWGCEIMENACLLADLQEQELKARCRLWGLFSGSINLQRGDFLENTAIRKALQRADVVLVNNQAFTPELNDSLTNQFLDLKEGCQIVSLKSFVPAGHKINSRNLNSAYNILDVVEKRYYSACVSWTDAGGSYFVSTKDSSRLRKYAEKAIGRE
ncbi:MAG: hypothetical protein LQ345_003722 [Seirophora villosa]|nr:MAG: hypothetical protein LQ345_003722 [Seirophora villosa]